MKVRIKPRILKYGPGKRPEMDEPDEVIEGPEREETLFGQEAEFIREALRKQENDHADL
jgi:hypothetical protein